MKGRMRVEGRTLYQDQKACISQSAASEPPFSKHQVRRCDVHGLHKRRRGGGRIRSFDSRADQPCLIYYMRSPYEAQAIAVAKRSALAIDAYHQSFERETWTRVEWLELLVDLCRE